MAIAATKLPAIITMSADLNLKSNNAAASEPLHTPVPGKGMATMIKSPHRPYLSIFSRCLSLFLRMMALMSFLKKVLCFSKKINICLMSKIIKGAGKSDAGNVISKVKRGGISKYTKAMGIDPLSSIKGIMEMMATMISLVKKSSRFRKNSVMVITSIVGWFR